MKNDHQNRPRDFMGRLTEIHGMKGLEKQFDYNYKNK